MHILIACTGFAADPALRKKRKQKGGNSGKNFTEGWVEFEDKDKAKEVREGLQAAQLKGRAQQAAVESRSRSRSRADSGLH